VGPGVFRGITVEQGRRGFSPSGQRFVHMEGDRVIVIDAADIAAVEFLD